MNPKVTIIIPTFNRKDYITEAIKSALNQTFSDYEILILDDASTDDTHEIIKPLLEDGRIRYICHPQNIGITANRNYGISISKGEYIAMLDSDDVWTDECKIKRQVEILDTHPDIGIIGTYTKIINEEDKVIGKIKYCCADSSIRRKMLKRNQFTQSGVVVRKDAIEKAGFYDVNIPIWEDYELWLRIGKLFKFRNIPEFMTAYRDHRGNISKESYEKSIRTYEIIYKLYKSVYPNSWFLLFKIVAKKAKLSLQNLS